MLLETVAVRAVATSARRVLAAKGQDVNRSTVDLLEAMLLELHSLNARLERIEQKLASTAETPSSVEIKTSTRGVDIGVKAYAGSDVVDPRTRAVEQYFAAIEDVQQRLNGP